MNIQQDENFNYDRDTWTAGIDPYFAQSDVLVRHQIHSFDHFLEHDIPEIIGNSSPQEIGAGWDPKTKQYARKYRYRFGKIYISKPLVLESNESISTLMPNVARMRELTYAAPIFVDVEHEIEVINESGAVIKDSKVESKVPLAKIPIILFSKYCYLHDAEKNNKTLGELGEDEFERGGYTIVNGSEKVLIGQERPAENKVLCFKNKSSTKYTGTVEVKSTRDQRLYPIKVTTVNLTKEPTIKDTKNLDVVPGRTIRVTIYSLKVDIPLFVIFRALGIITDKEIFQFILYNINNPDQNFVNLLLPSCEEALRVKDPDDKTNTLEIRTEEAALKYMSNPKILKYDTSFLGKQENPDEARQKYIKDLINRELFPHMGEDNRKKAYFLGYMTRRLLECFLGIRPYDDRDHYSNKRVNLTGALYAKIFSANFTRLNRKLKADILKHLSADVAPKSVFPGFRKGIQGCSIDTNLKYALSTGNWATTKSGSGSSANKGVAQVLQRMSAIQTLSHLRRIQSPLERTGSKLVPPRKLHATQVGFICPNETPEGAQVGVVKNLAFMAHITTHTNPVRVFLILREFGVRSLDEISPYEMDGATKVFVNGHMYGIIQQGLTKKIYDNLKLLKKNNVGLDHYTSIRWFIEFKELVINTDGGRYSRPVYVVHERGGVPTLLLETNWKKIKSQLDDGSFDWNNLLGSEWNDNEPPRDETDMKDLCKGNDLKPETSAIIEYIDTDETEESLIAVTHNSLIENHSIDKVLIEADGRGSNYQVGDKLIFNNAGTNGYGASGEVSEVGEDGSIRAVKLNSKGRDYLKTPTVSVVSVNGKGAVLKVTKKNTTYNYTHCEIHPTMWFGVVSQGIPFMEHNPSPRNCFQCLWKEEQILMGDGSFKKIKDVRVGDIVISVNPTTLVEGPATVINHFVKTTEKKIVKIVLVGGGTLTCTDDHLILSQTGWIKAGDLGSYTSLVWCKWGSNMNDYGLTMVENVEPMDNCEISDITLDNDWHSFVTRGGGIVVHNSSMQKQAIGIYATNYNSRMDTMAHVLCYPQKPLVFNRTIKYTCMDKLPQGQQLVVAIACYTGYNQEDSVMVNKSGVDRGMMSVLSLKTYKDKEQKHKSVTSMNGMETFGKPDRNLTKDMRGKAEDYAAIDETGVAKVGSYIHGGDIIIGKYIELRPEDKESTGKQYKDISKELKHNDDGYVDKVLNGKTGVINTNSEGERIAKVRIAQLRRVEIADKFATRAAQKGTIGMMYRQEDMPFTSHGVVPDVIFNPHGIPSRMTVGQLLENLCGKVAALKGQMMDSTPFTKFNQADVEEMLENYGFSKSCDEVMFNGFSGQQFKIPIFIGPTYYQRLKHMVQDKLHSRESGPVQLMTRQPQEGRSRDGGLRLGGHFA